MRNTAIVHDNIGTRLAPTWRARHQGPLTPRAVRQDLVRMAMEQPEGERQAWIDRRLTALDRLLSEGEAQALERYCLCEMIRMGSARCADYAGDRVQSSRSDMSPLSDDWLTKLALHRPLQGANGAVLAIFVRQYAGEDDAPSEAEAAFRLGLPGRDRRAAWQAAVKAAAGALVG